MITGIIGGILMFAAMITSILFNRNMNETAMAISIWNPHTGNMPMKIPKPTEKDFNAFDSSGLRSCSRKSCLMFFFLATAKGHVA